MKKIFQKALTIGASTAMVGLTVASAAAAAYPQPFVAGGSADVAVVIGADAALSDAVAATNIGSDLATELAAQTATGSEATTSISGDAVSLDSGSSRIWLNTSLNTAKSILNKNDLPVVLGDTTFSGNVEAKLTSTIEPMAANDTGGVNSGAIIFAKQPKSNVDPILGITMSSTRHAGLYNATVTMKVTNFTHADSEGETITLFGRDFVISTATTNSRLVLYSSAEEISLQAGGDSPNPSATVVIDGSEYAVELVTGTSDTATVAVNGESREVNEGSSRKINGIEVAVKSVTESSALNTITATLLVGSEKITLTPGSKVTKGSDDDPVDGTTVTIVGGPEAATELTVAVSRPSASNDAVLEGTPFVDPVFGSFKVDFQGISSPLDDADRDMIEVGVAGDDTMTLTVDGVTLDWAHNQSSQFKLGDDSNYTIYVREMANVTEEEYLVVGNEDYGHLLVVDSLNNDTSSDATKDTVRFLDALTGDPYTASITSEEAATSSGTISIEGKPYTVTAWWDSNTNRVQLKYPSSDSATANAFVFFPTFQTGKGTNLALYEPQVIDLANVESTTDMVTLNLPDGDGYTAVTFDYLGAQGGAAEVWSVTPAGGSAAHINISTDAGKSNYTTFNIGQFTYNLTGVSNGLMVGAGTANTTGLFLQDPEGNARIDGPAIQVFYGKDDNNQYEGFVVDTKDDPAGSSSNGVEVDNVLYTTQEYLSGDVSLDSDSDITQNVDWWGTLVNIDANDDQTVMSAAIPTSQVYTNIFVGDVDAAISTGSSSGSATELGSVTVYDNEAASVSGKNLIVVGGSCINSVAAELLGEAACGEEFEALTGVAAGGYLIQSFDRSGKVALLVAGYNAADTTKAATYLTNNAVNTTAGTKLTGTSATEATVVTA